MLPNPLSCVHEACEALSRGSEVQTLIFARSQFTKAQARAWARDHGFRAGYVDEKPKTFRIRQASPTGFRRMRTITLRPGVQAVIGYP